MSRGNLAVLALSLTMSGCFEGPQDVHGEPWQGQAADEHLDTDGVETSGGESSGGPIEVDTDDDPTSDPTGDPGPDPTGDETTGGSGAEDPPPADQVPETPYCSDVAVWDASYTQLEDEILALVNQRRAEGANCGSEGSFGPTGPLAMNPALRCASRVHSKDMVERNFFDHTNPSGQSPFDRMLLAGYSYSTAGENIAAGSSTAAATMQQWMNSDGHCRNIMNPAYSDIGVGYYPGGANGYVWTQGFGSP